MEKLWVPPLTSWQCRKVRLLLALSLAALTGVIVAAETDEGDDPEMISVKGEIKIQQYDEVYFKDGGYAKGILTEGANAGEYKIRNVITNATRPFTTDETKEVRRRATPERELERISKMYAGNAEKLNALAKVFFKYYDPNLKPKLIEMLIKAKSSNPGLLETLCGLQLDAGDGQQALKTADTLVTATPQKGRSYMLRGKAYMALGTLDAAEKDLEKAFKLTPDDQEIVVSRAEYLLGQGRAQEAKDMFAAALAKNSKNVAALVGQGLVLLRQGEFKDAEESLKTALQIKPRQKQAQLGMAAAKIMLKQYDEACSEAKDALNIDPDCAEAFALQAFAKVLSGDPEQLKDFYAAAKNAFIKKAGQPRLLLANAVAIEREAKSLEALGSTDALKDAKLKREEAAAKYKEVFELNPPDAYMQYFIGEQKFRQGDYAAAETAFERAAKLAPAYAPAQAALGAVSLRLGKGDKAKEAYARAVKLDPTTKEAADYFAGQGVALLKVKELEQAKESFKQAQKLDPRNATALCGMGYIFNFDKNKESALDYFQQALAADGSCAYAADALRRIYQQDNLSLEYVTFSDGNLPNKWTLRQGIVKANVVDGRLLFSGTQGTATGGKVEIYKDVKADEFVRFEADLEMSPTSPVTFGIRMGSSTNAAVAFEMEYAKDETNEVKVRFRDFGGVAPNWQSTKLEWPSDGRLRLAISTDDLKTGKVGLWFNGKKTFDLNMNVQKPGRVTVGVYVQAPPKEEVNASADNLVLVTRGPVVQDEGAGALTPVGPPPTPNDNAAPKPPVNPPPPTKDNK
ncbi:MAG TPA: tetratricopeptide repeat protein [Planctomycetota bacterium]|jgi:tetratricopeptide (TPR) repeat protein